MEMPRFVLLALLLAGCADQIDLGGFERPMGEHEHEDDSADDPITVDVPQDGYDAPVLPVHRPDHAPGRHLLRRVDVPPLTDVVFDTFEQPLAYGVGGALVDFDDDGDVDLVTSSHAAGDGCVWENVSSPGDIQFRTRPDWCLPADRALHGAIEMGPRLIGYGVGWIGVLEPGVDELHVNEIVDFGARRCGINAVLPIDFDADGDLDLLVACTRGLDGPGDQPNLVLRAEEDGFQWVAESEVPNLVHVDNSLAFGAWDRNADGLMDVALVNDTFSYPGRVHTESPAGGLLERCAPTQSCAYRLLAWLPNERRWGSYMGFGVVSLDGLGDHMILSDQGPTRLIDPSGPEWFDRAERVGFGIELGQTGFNFSWGVVVDDFDDNGLDDVFVTQGMVTDPLPNLPQRFGEHIDLLYLQRPGGSFVPMGENAGIDPCHRRPHARAAWRTLPGAAAKVDLDLDGSLEIVELPFEGNIRVYATATSDRCSIDPVPAYTPVVGYGIGVGESVDRIRHRDVQGQQRLGLPRFVSGPRSGFVEFPSGAIVPYECDRAGPTVVEEPNWISMWRDGDDLVVELEGDWLSAQPQVTPPSATPTAP